MIISWIGLSIGMIIGGAISIIIFETAPNYYAAEFRLRIAAIVAVILFVIEIMYLIVR